MLVACSGKSTTAPPAPTTFVAPATSGTPREQIRAAALAYSRAFLTGTPADLAYMQGPECTRDTSTTYSDQFLAAYLKGMRATIQRHIGVDLGRIKVRGVALRNVSSTRAEADVQYDLPESATGNDNWVEYTLHDGRWKVSNCDAPIGGSSSSSESSATRPPSAASSIAFANV